jgi:hypothetical protein
MLTLAELRRLAGTLTAPSFTEQLGPFVLIQRPEEAWRHDPELLSTQAVGARAIEVTTASLLLQGLDTLQVANLPPFRGVEALAVGRLPDCDLVLDHPSVSKRHAVVRWDPGAQRCTLQDLGSTNGTRVNGSLTAQREVSLRDGDLLAFGEMPFWYLVTDTLHRRLQEERVRRGEPLHR